MASGRSLSRHLTVTNFILAPSAVLKASSRSYLAATGMICCVNRAVSIRDFVEIGRACLPFMPRLRARRNGFALRRCALHQRRPGYRGHVDARGRPGAAFGAAAGERSSSFRRARDQLLAREQEMTPSKTPHDAGGRRRYARRWCRCRPDLGRTGRLIAGCSFDPPGGSPFSRPSALDSARGDCSVWATEPRRFPRGARLGAARR